MSNVCSILSKYLLVVQEIYLTDSAIAIYWVQHVIKHFKQYVKNRVTKIKELTNIESRSHIPGLEDIADFQSRGCLPEYLLSRAKLWIERLRWLKQVIASWSITKHIQKH